LDCIEKIRPYCRILEIETELAIKHNEMAVKSMKMNPKRRKFIQNIDKMDFGELASKYGTPSYTPKQHIGRMLRKMGLR
jgi:3-keto-L-gulonate-6-phosphate decarboxylase